MQLISYIFFERKLLSVFLNETSIDFHTLIVCKVNILQQIPGSNLFFLIELKTIPRSIERHFLMSIPLPLTSYKEITLYILRIAVCIWYQQNNQT